MCVLDPEVLYSYFEYISKLNIAVLILDVECASPDYFKVLIPRLLELPNIRENLEELEVKSKFEDNIESFISNWHKYSQFCKLKQVKLCSSIICNDYSFANIKDTMREYFAEIKRNHDLMICSIKR